MAGARAGGRAGREGATAGGGAGREGGRRSEQGWEQGEREGRGRTAARRGHGGPLLLRREEGAAAMACLHRATARASTAPPWIRRGALDPGLVAAARREEGGRGEVEGRGEEGLNEQRRRRGRRLGTPAGEEEVGGAGGAGREEEGGDAGKSGGEREAMFG